jgi:hypothetical protein
LNIFYICHWCQQHQWCTFSCEYLRESSKKFEMPLMVYSRAWGKPIQEKNLKSKISWRCLFNPLATEAWMECRKNFFTFLHGIRPLEEFSLILRIKTAYTLLDFAEEENRFYPSSWGIYYFVIILAKR